MTDHSWMDSELKGAAAAWHNLCDHAAQCAEIARDVDPAKLPVTDDYLDAREQLYAAVETRILHEVDDATERFQAAFISVVPSAALRSGAGANEVALFGAVMALRGARHHLGEALAQLEQRYPTAE
ncbi:hypothetical protein ABZ470_39960 [Streptosporangium sp. NPDC020072]|uniref:hypothetical protein n=1 Tax=Streptosporangium sp. NPDC020072 TaxID=3154788 RepID=UPI00342991EE